MPHEEKSIFTSMGLQIRALLAPEANTRHLTRAIPGRSLFEKSAWR
jgi:hypothetical protein